MRLTKYWLIQTANTKLFKMNIKILISKISSSLLMTSTILMLISCSDVGLAEKVLEDTEAIYKETKPKDVIKFFEHWNLILGDGSNVGQAIDYSDERFFYTIHDEQGDWVVFKSPNGGNTHGTYNNTRTELAQLKKWSPMTENKMNATLKVMNVSESGDARVAATYAVVVGQIHSADGHENEPLKIFYKKFPDHQKGSVFWNYEINTKGSNDGRWDYSTAVWGHDFSVVGPDSSTYPEEPQDGIALGEEFSYEVNVYEGIMYLTFTSEGHEPKTFTKNLLKSDFAKKSDKFVIKAGYLDGEAADASKIEAFAKLPGREQLLGMLAATWMAPVANFTIGLDALRRQKEEA